MPLRGGRASHRQARGARGHGTRIADHYNTLSMPYLCFIYALSMLYLCLIYAPSPSWDTWDSPFTRPSLIIPRQPLTKFSLFINHNHLIVRQPCNLLANLP